MKTLRITALVVAIVGALNWGLVGFFQFDLVAAIFGGQTEILSRIVYALVGVAGITLLFTTPEFSGRPPAARRREYERTTRVP